MAPPPFPLLLVVPALAIDLLMQRFGGRRGFWHDTGLALLLGLAFFLVFFAAHWWFSEFLLSPLSRNRVFAGDAQWGYYYHLGEWRTQFWNLKEDSMNWKSGLIAVAFAALVSRIGLWFGSFLAAVKR
jgi:uncharacterized membrane protein